MSKNQSRNIRLSWPHVLTSSYIKVLYLLKFTPELIDWLLLTSGHQSHTRLEKCITDIA